MGQYYKPVSVEKKEHVYSHDFGNGLKLMEHSWIGNNFVNQVEKLIAEGGSWYGDRIVWAGDYADKETNPEVLDSENENRPMNLYQICQNKINPTEKGKQFKYVINLDTKEYVNTKKIPLTDVYIDEKGKHHDYVIHPLPLLTCEGNGRGGGDFHKNDPLVGKWARNRVSVSMTIPKGFKELKFNLFEGDLPAERPVRQKEAV